MEYRITETEMDEIQNFAHLLWLSDGEIYGLNKVPKTIKKPVGRTRRAVSKKEEKEIIELHNQGLHFRDIAEIKSRHFETIKKVLQKHKKQKGGA